MPLRRLFSVILSVTALAGCATYSGSAGRHGVGPGEYYSGKPVVQYRHPYGSYGRSPYFPGYYYGGYGAYYGHPYGYYPYGHVPYRPIRPVRPLPPRPGGGSRPRPPANNHGDHRPPNDRLPPWRHPAPRRGEAAPPRERPAIPRNTPRHNRPVPSQNRPAPSSWRRPAPTDNSAARPPGRRAAPSVRPQRNPGAQAPRSAPRTQAPARRASGRPQRPERP